VKQVSEKIRVCWLSGGYFDRHNWLSKIKDSLGPHIVRTYGKNISLSFLQKEIRQRNLFNLERRLFVLTDIPLSDTTQPKTIVEIQKLIKKIPDDVVLVFNGIDSNTTIDKLVKSVAEIGKVFYSPVRLSRNAAIEYVIKLSTNMKKKFSEEVAGAVFTVLAGSEFVETVETDRVYTLVHLLVCYAGKQNVTEDDVDLLGFSADDFVIWKFFDALDTKNLNISMKFVHRGILEASSSTEFANSFFSTVIWRYRLLLMISELLRTKDSPAKVSEAFGKFYKLKREGFGEHAVYIAHRNKDSDELIRAYSPVVISRAMSSPMLSRSRMIEVYNAAESSVHKLRSRCTEAEVQMLVEGFVLQVCGKMDDKLLCKMREDAYE